MDACAASCQEVLGLIEGVGTKKRHNEGSHQKFERYAKSQAERGLVILLLGGTYPISRQSVRDLVKPSSPCCARSSGIAAVVNCPYSLNEEESHLRAWQRLQSGRVRHYQKMSTGTVS